MFESECQTQRFTPIFRRLTVFARQGRVPSPLSVDKYGCVCILYNFQDGYTPSNRSTDQSFDESYCLYIRSNLRVSFEFEKYCER